MNPARPPRVQGRVWARVLAVALASLATASPAAEEVPARDAQGCAKAVAAALQRRYEAVGDLEASFEQTTRSVGLGQPGATAKSRGSVVFAKPGRMRWTYAEPEPSLVVSEGKQLWIYDPAHREVQRLGVGGA